MRYLFNVLPRAGHLNASIALAHRLVAAGDSVHFFCFERPRFVEERLRRAGLGIACSGPAEDAPEKLPGTRDAMTRRLRDPRWRRRFFEYSFVHVIEPQVPALRLAIAELGPDVVCTDAMADAGAIAAELERVPWASLSSMMDLAAPPDLACPWRHSLQEIAAARDGVASAAGVSLAHWWSNVVSPSLNLAFFATLAPLGHAAPPHTHFVGPCRLPVRGDEVAFPWERVAADRPLVYVSSGTELAWEPAIVADIERAVLQLGAQAVIAPVDDDGERAPDGIVRVRYAPQLALLARASLAITHGGTNSVMETLGQGVPLVVIPIDYDQPVTALQVERAGVGVALDPARWDGARCLEVMRALLRAEAPERARSREVQAELAACDGAQRAAQLLRDTYGA